MASTSTVTLRGGADMPLLGFGTWQLRNEEAYRAVTDALEVGYRLIDTATVYRNEAEVGAAIRACGLPRQELFITTKLPAERADKPRETLEHSLELLGLDQLDLWLIHWPPHGQAAPEIWHTLLAARDAGLVRAVGVSNYSTAQLDEISDATGEMPEVNQIEWSPALYDGKRHRELTERGCVLEGYSPFKASNLRDRTLRDVASKHHVSVPQVIIRWHLQHATPVIPKSARRERIESNFDVLGFELSDEEMRRIDALGSP